MNLSDHLRPLLRDHDCVIIPDFGGLVAEYVSARVQPAGRHLLSPPTRQVAFNQALTRNDGLLLDALRQHLGLSTAEAREQLRQAVAELHQELQAQQRTELPGIGVFRQFAGRGLQFEYTGTENLLAAAFGLPELTAHPVPVIDARLAREQQAQLVPRLRSAAQRSGAKRVPLRQLVRGGAIGLAAGLVAAAAYLLSLHPSAVPVAWQPYLPKLEQADRPLATQQASLARPSLSEMPVAPAPAPVAAATETDASKMVVEMPTVVLNTKKLKANAPVATVAKPVTMNVKDSKKLALAPATPAVAKVVAKAAAPVSATTIKARTGRYYIVVAAYSSLLRAEEGRRNLAHAGRPAKVITPPFGSRLYRLSAVDFPDKPTAMAAATRLRQNPHFDKGLTVLAY
jgi:cell division protein FtsN